MTRLVQIRNRARRVVALVAEPQLQIIDGADSIYQLAASAAASDIPLPRLVAERAGSKTLNFDDVYCGKSDWRLLPPMDHPDEPSRCLVSGTGLTHLGSAANRQRMHEAKEAELTDSMKMFRLGVAGGKPRPGKIGVAPEWFYKGNGTILRAHGEPLDVPGFAEDGGEEAEIAGVYFIGADGAPRRVGMAVGNEFSDHKFEKGNYLNLAGSKLRTCALGPELVIDPQFVSVSGSVKIERAGTVFWSQTIVTGENEMSHSLANLEHHHFKFDAHRRPGDVHIHYFGAHSLSFGAGIRLAEGDVMEISFATFGRPLRNPLRVATRQNQPVVVRSLG